MENAYDLIWTRRILDILHKYNLIGNIFYFIQNFLNDRSIIIKVNNIMSKAISITNGVPQGSLISVTIFLLAFNDISNHIKPPVTCTIFADYITLFIKGKNIKTNEEILQQSLAHVKPKFQYFLNQHSNVYLEKDERQALRIC